MGNSSIQIKVVYEVIILKVCQNILPVKPREIETC